MQGRGGFRARGSAGYAVNLAMIAGALLIALVFYVCFFSHLAALGLVGPDEPRYSSVARTMAERGDWVTPRLDGQPWFEKPVLYYWCAAAAFRVFRASELAARLPSALAAALAALGMGWIAWRSYGYEAARAVLLIFPTCIGVFGFARAATPDMLFSAALAGAMVVGSHALHHAQAQERGSMRVAFGAFLGMATLAKGPAAIALAAGSMGLWALGTRRWRDVYRLVHPLALGAFCIIALPWYMLCAARNPDFVHTFLFEHNFERYLTLIFRHEQPFWFFGPVLLLGLLPWTVLLAGAARDGVRLWDGKAWAGSAGFFFACWAIFPVVFFSFSKSKLPGYVLPALPPLVLLVARSITRSLEEKERFARLLAALVGGTLVTLAGSAGYWLKRLPKESGLADPHRALAWIVLAAAGGLAVALLGARRPAAGVLAAALLMAGLAEGANRNLLPQLDPHLSPRAAARAALSHAAADPISVYRVHRAWRYGLNFYLHRTLPEWTPQSPRPAWLYTSAAGLIELERQGMHLTIVERTSPQAIFVRVAP